MEDKLPLTPAEVAEKVLFLYGVDKKSNEFKEGIAKIKDIVTDKELEKVVNDLAVLINGSTNHPNYNSAFKRYNNFYSELDNVQLIDYCRFLCKTFDIKPTNEFKLDKMEEHSYKLNRHL